MSAFKPNYISTIELARILGISRVGVLKRIQRGAIPAIKIGRSYAIPESFVSDSFPLAKSRILDDQSNMSVMEAAQILGVSRFVIAKRIERGQIEATKVGRHYVIAKSTIEALKNKESKEIVTEKEYLSIPEYARLVQMSRIAVYKKVKSGHIPAKKVGRHFVIAVDDLRTHQVKESSVDQSIDKHWSVAELASQLGISRIAVFKRIERGTIKAIKIGRSYAISTDEVNRILVKLKNDKQLNEE